MNFLKSAPTVHVLPWDWNLWEIGTGEGNVLRALYFLESRAAGKISHGEACTKEMSF